MFSRTLRITSSLVVAVGAVTAIDAAGATAAPAHHRVSTPPGLHASQHPPLRAHVASATYPYVGDVSSTCDVQHQYIRAYAPVWVSPWVAGSAELVYYRADLYRYTTAGWTLVDSTPWGRGIATYNGLQSLDQIGSKWWWYNNSTHTYVPQPYYPFGWVFSASQSVHGTYEVVENVEWSSTGADRRTVAKFDAGYYCTY